MSDSDSEGPPSKMRRLAINHRLAKPPLPGSYDSAERPLSIRYHSAKRETITTDDLLGLYIIVYGVQGTESRTIFADNIWPDFVFDPTHPVSDLATPRAIIHCVIDYKKLWKKLEALALQNGCTEPHIYLDVLGYHGNDRRVRSSLDFSRCLRKVLESGKFVKGPDTKYDMPELSFRIVLPEATHESPLSHHDAAEDGALDYKSLASTDIAGEPTDTVGAALEEPDIIVNPNDTDDKDSTENGDIMKNKPGSIDEGSIQDEGAGGPNVQREKNFFSSSMPERGKSWRR